MSEEAMKSIAQPNSRFLSDVLWWATVLLGAVLILWILGFEAIIYHPTPFYGLWMPVGSFGFLSFAAAVVSAVAAGTLFIAPGAGVRLPDVLFALALVLAVAGFLTGLGVDDSFGGLMHHAVAAILAASCIAVLGSVLHPMFAGDAEPSQKSARYVVLGIMVFAIVFPGVIAMLRGGADAIAQPYTRYDHEYIGDIGIGGSIFGLFAQYESVHEHLSMHSKVHPPGPVAILWVMSFVVGREPLALALATMAFGALSVWPLYGLTNAMFGSRRVALVAAALYAVVPTIVLFTATSTDIAFMPFTLGALYFFWRAMHRPSIVDGLIAGVFYAIMSLTSFSLLVVGGFFGMVGLWRLTQPEHRNAVVTTAISMIVSFLGVHLIVYMLTGFNVIEVFFLSKGQFDTDQMHLDELTPRYSAPFFRIVNPFCWLFFAGIPLVVLFLKRLGTKSNDGRVIFFIFAAMLILLDLLYLARGEGERSAMYIMPFAVIPAAHFLAQWCGAKASAGPLALVLSLMAAQCWAMESLLYTYW